MEFFIDDSKLKNGKFADVIVNGEPIGDVCILQNHLLWAVGMQLPKEVRDLIKDTTRLKIILDYIEDFCKKCRYDGLIIRNCPGDIGTFFAEKEWNVVGYMLAPTKDIYIPKTEK